MITELSIKTRIEELRKDNKEIVKEMRSIKKMGKGLKNIYDNLIKENCIKIVMLEWVLGIKI